MSRATSPEASHAAPRADDHGSHPIGHGLGDAITQLTSFRRIADHLIDRRLQSDHGLCLDDVRFLETAGERTAGPAVGGVCGHFVPDPGAVRRRLADRGLWKAAPGAGELSDRGRIVLIEAKRTIEDEVQRLLEAALGACAAEELSGLIALLQRTRP